ncbi:MAG: hypothetical protein KBF43_09020 [Dermatophilaceae bacterium]|nr:hypothetical protein [Dermatophilaceae bacterium]
MRLTYQPEGVDARSWDFTFGGLFSHEAEAMERQTGLSIQQLGTLLRQGSALAVHALLWVLMRRDADKRTLKFDELQFRLGEVTLDLDDEEKRRALEQIDDQIAAGEDVDADLLAARDELAKQLDVDPKDPAPTGN